MKREFITNLLPEIDKDVLDQIMAEHGKDIEAQKAALTAVTTERDTLKTQLDEANTQIQGFKDLDVEGIKKKAADWEAKYTADTQQLKDQLAAAEYEHSVETAVSSLKFSSSAAKKQFVADLTAKKLPLQEGKLLGLEDYVKAYQESDPGAFEQDDGKTPIFSRGGSAGGGGLGDDAALRAAFGLPIETKK